jgi:hypothetical protein
MFIASYLAMGNAVARRHQVKSCIGCILRVVDVWIRHLLYLTIPSMVGLTRLNDLTLPSLPNGQQVIHQRTAGIWWPQWITSKSWTARPHLTFELYVCLGCCQGINRQQLVTAWRARCREGRQAKKSMVVVMSKMTGQRTRSLAQVKSHQIRPSPICFLWLYAPLQTTTLTVCPSANNNFDCMPLCKQQGCKVCERSAGKASISLKENHFQFHCFTQSLMPSDQSLAC